MIRRDDLYNFAMSFLSFFLTKKNLKKPRISYPICFPLPFSRFSGFKKSNVMQWDGQGSNKSGEMNEIRIIGKKKGKKGGEIGESLVRLVVTTMGWTKGRSTRNFSVHGVCGMADLTRPLF
jgi:hypothetical protein